MTMVVIQLTVLTISVFNYADNIRVVLFGVVMQA